jgi:hypothetical protein
VDWIRHNLAASNRVFFLRVDFDQWFRPRVPRVVDSYSSRILTADRFTLREWSRCRRTRGPPLLALLEKSVLVGGWNDQYTVLAEGNICCSEARTYNPEERLFDQNDGTEPSSRTRSARTVC